MIRAGERKRIEYVRVVTKADQIVRDVVQAPVCGSVKFLGPGSMLLQDSFAKLIQQKPALWSTERRHGSVGIFSEGQRTVVHCESLQETSITSLAFSFAAGANVAPV